MIRTLSAAVLALAISGGAAMADPITFSGSYSFTDTSSSTDQLSFTTTYNYATPFSGTLSVGQSVTIDPLATLSITNNQAGSSVLSAAIQAAVTFTLPSSGSGTLGGNVAQVTIDLLGHYTSAGALVWTGGNGGTSLDGSTENVFFTDGAELAITLGDGVFLNGNGANNSQTVSATVELLQAPTAVPEPASLALLGGSLVGLGALRRRRAR